MPRRNRVRDEIKSDQEDEKGETIAAIKTAASKKKTKTKQDASNQNDLETAKEDGQNENDAYSLFDKEKFLETARPISREQLNNIERVVTDLQHLTLEVDRVGFDLVTEAARAIGEVSVDTRDGEELDLLMRNLIDAQEEIKAHQQSLDDLKQRILRGEHIDDLENAYTTRATELKNDYAQKTTRQKYARQDKYFNFREQVWEVNHEDAMPPLKGLLPREENDSEDDSDIEVGGKTQDYKCPLSLTIMKNPMTAPCGHSFSRDAIQEYLQNGRKRATCPATGCQQPLVLSDFKLNDHLARRIADHVRRVRRKADESDEDNTQVVD